MRNKKIRIPLIVIGSTLLFLFSGFIPILYFIISPTQMTAYYGVMILWSVTIIIGIFGFRGKMKSEQIEELKDRINDLEEKEDEKD